MSDTVIKIEGLSKKYLLNHKQGPSDGLRHVFQRALQAPWTTLQQKLGQAGKPGGNFRDEAAEEFWALKDVSFEVKRGEVVGVIGRNGAGKSTLLKLLSRITEPTSGRIEIEGRVASLLEVGTGFHAELTGRENIFLNGAILGMTQAEVRRKFDEIVAFAEVEKFLDTPVRFYSSGMYVRLAFAVAAHLEPEILIVDEVLAVGDAQFQRKCLGKMRDVTKAEGRTILFVSHNMAALEGLCSRGVLLQQGRLVSQGNLRSQIEAYLAMASEQADLGLPNPVVLSAGMALVQLAISPNPVVSGAEAMLTLELSSEQQMRYDELCVLIYSALGTRVAILDLRQVANWGDLCGRQLRARAAIDALQLVEGDYFLGLWIRCNQVQGEFLNLSRFMVAAQSSESGFVSYSSQHRGFVELKAKIKIS